MEEIEHSVSGLNGRVSPGASGCQMMDGMDTILHPPEHRAPAPSPQPPTSIPPSSLQSTFLHSGLGTPAATQGGGGDRRAALLSLGLTLALIPSLAALRSENSWAPGDKDQSPRGMCVCAQEKGERIQQFLPWGKTECPSSHTHTHHKVDQTASLEKRRKKEGGCKQKCPLLFFFIGGGYIERHPANNIIAAMWRVIIAIQAPIIHIKQGEASLSFACLRLYAFEKSFPQGV